MSLWSLVPVRIRRLFDDDADNLDTCGHAKTITPLTRMLYVLLWVFCFVALFQGLWTGSLRMWDEALTAGRASDMLSTGDWLTVHLNGCPDYNKPPLYYWLTALLFKMFGRDEFFVRFGSALFGLGCLLLVERIASRCWKSRYASLMAVFLLVSNPHWINRTREGLLDSGLMLSMLAAIYLLSFRHAKRTRRDLVLVGLSLAFGALIKNPLSLIVLLIPFWERWTRNRPLPRWQDWSLVIGTFLLAAAPWYTLQIILHGRDFLDFFFGFNVVDRFVSGVQGHARPWTFYVNQWRGQAPVSLLLFGISFLGWLTTGRQNLRKASPIAFILGLWIILLLCSASKRAPYLLYLYPFIALLTCGFLQGIIKRLPGRCSSTILLALVATGALLDFAHHYRVTLDFSPAQKEIGLMIHNADIRPKVVLCFDLPANVIGFYSETDRIDSSSAEDIVTDCESIFRNATPHVFIVTPKTSGPAIRKAFENATRSLCGIRQLGTKGEYTLLLATQAQ